MNFTIQSDEQLPITGNLDVPERPRGLVVVVHGFKGFKDWGFFPWLGQRLLQHRLAVCRFNMSRSGIGDDPESFDRLDLFENDTYSIQLADLRAVMRFVRKELPALPLFLFGHSRGGAVAILGAQEAENLHGVVAWSPIAQCDRWDDATKREWRARGFVDNVNQRTKQNMRVSTAVLDDYEANRERLDVAAAVRRLRVPLLVVHGARDESVPVSEGRSLAALTQDASLLVIEQAGHTFNAIHPLIHVPGELIVVAETTAHFFNAHA
jgi:uncharacterized protein